MGLCVQGKPGSRLGNATSNMVKTIESHGIQRIVSGGQTGVDQAALDVAIEIGIPHGGWCPKGRLCENGRIPNRYHLKELAATEYVARTEQNVIDSDGTLILYRTKLQGGTAATDRMAKKHSKPVLRIRMDARINYVRIVEWLGENQIRVLNVAGPRASSHPATYDRAVCILRTLFST